MQPEQLLLFQLDTPVMEKLDTSRVTMKEINHDTAKRICEDCHYSGTYPAGMINLGFYIDDVLNLIIVYGRGANNNTVHMFDGMKISQQSVLELVRLYSFDWAGSNIESYCIARSFEYLRAAMPEVKVLLSYADPTQGHVGVIYQATNWIYTGTASGVEMYYDPKTNKMRHSRIMSDYRKEYPSMTRAEIQKMLGWQKVGDTKKKHRYIYFLGDKRQKKEMRTKLKYPILPYPKMEGP